MRTLPRLSLRADHLFAAARSQAGLDDFGDEAFRDGLRRFLDSLESEANLTPIGRMGYQRNSRGVDARLNGDLTVLLLLD